MSRACGEISLLVWMIFCPFLVSKSSPALGCCAGQLQAPTIPSPNPLMFRNPHFPQLIFKKNHMDAHPCFYLSVRKNKKRGEEVSTGDFYPPLLTEQSLLYCRIWEHGQSYSSCWRHKVLCLPVSTYFKHFMHVYKHDHKFISALFIKTFPLHL